MVAVPNFITWVNGVVYTAAQLNDQIYDSQMFYRTNRPYMKIVRSTNFALPAYNLLISNTDSTFESTVGQWATGGNSSVARSTVKKNTGTAALAVTGTAAGNAIAVSTGATAALIGSGSANAIAGQSYYARCYVIAGATARAGVITLSWINSSNAEISVTTAVTPANNTTTGTLWSVTGVAPAGTVKVRMKVQFTGVAASEVHYIDDALIKVGTTESATSLLTMVPFESEAYDTDNMYTVGDSTFTINTSGIYSIGVQASWPTANVIGNQMMVLCRNGSTINDAIATITSRSTTTYTKLGWTGKLNSGDFLRVGAYHTLPPGSIVLGSAAPGTAVTARYRGPIPT